MSAPYVLIKMRMFLLHMVGAPYDIVSIINFISHFTHFLLNYVLLQF